MHPKGQVQVLHFIGHGAFDAGLGEGALLFEGSRGLAERVSEDRLSALLLDHPAVRLVFLNACDGARHDEYDGFGGVAQRLLQQGVPAVIAMQRAISDRAATLFSSTFYAELARGVPIDAAVAKGRRAMRLAGHTVAWGAPVLYLRAADGVLFTRAAGEGRAPDRADVATPAVPPRRRRGPSRGALALGGIALALLAGLAYLWRLPRAVTGAGSRPAAAVPRTVPRSPECPSPPAPEILFVRIAPGAFEMGSTRSKDERPIHRVTLTQPFCLGAFEVTRRQWEAVMGPGREVSAARDGQLPKVDVSWEDVQVFLERLNRQTPRRDFRLPTEAQWEYAARAGTATRFSFGDDPGALYLHANCRSRAPHDDGYDDVAPVGAFPPNPWGLFDMEGNAREWVQDRFGPYPTAPVVDPPGAPTGELRVRRGGGWNSAVESCEPTHRTGSRPSLRRNDLGFRIVATPVH